jgi:alpha-glucosidase (family GH31 glycosyl hydrolase)
MMAKYHLYRYMATWTYVLSQQGGTLYKPLFFEFPDDFGAYLGDSNVMLGPAIKVQSSYDLVNNETNFYFP